MKASAKMIALFRGAVAVACVGLLYGCHQMAVTDMDEGERLYRAKCASCHQLIDPGTRTADEWCALLGDHGPRMTDGQRSAILGHLVRRARAALRQDDSVSH